MRPNRGKIVPQLEKYDLHIVSDQDMYIVIVDVEHEPYKFFVWKLIKIFEIFIRIFKK